VFDVDLSGWIAKNRGRAMSALIKEPIQNAMDENVSVIKVTLKEGYVEIEDDSELGIEELKNVFTLFASGKADNPTKRGRMGRGLKEFISACDFAEVRTTTGTVFFNVNDQTRDVDESVRTSAGTIIIGKTERWGNSNLAEALMFLRRMLMPEGMTLIVNVNGEDHVIEYREPESIIYPAYLTTVWIENGYEKKLGKSCNLEIHRTTEKNGYLCEMGIPVQPLECPYILNVQQRIPMNPNRDAAAVESVEEILARFINQNDFTYEELKKAWIQKRLGDYRITTSVVKDFMHRLFGDNVIVGTNGAHNDNARQHGYVVIKKSNVSDEFYDRLKKILPTATSVCKEIESQISRMEVPAKSSEKYLLNFVELLAREVLEEEYEVGIMECQPDSKGFLTMADHFNDGSTAKICLNRLAEFNWQVPFAPENTSVIIHELSHYYSKEHDMLFHDYYEKLFSKFMNLVVTKPELFKEYTGNHIFGRKSEDCNLLLDIELADEYGLDWAMDARVTATGSLLNIYLPNHGIQLTVGLKNPCDYSRTYKRTMHRNKLNVNRWMEDIAWNENGTVEVKIEKVN
jgi:hypothetical protein